MNRIGRGLFALGITGALTLGVATAATAADSPTPAQIKQADDAAGAWDVPPGWDPATAPAPTKPASAMPAASALNALAATTSASLVENQVSQQTSYYCGPAAVHEALNALGVSSNQDGLATKLGTTTDGTAWTTGSTYPVPTVLNNKTGTSWGADVDLRIQSHL